MIKSFRLWIMRMRYRLYIWIKYDLPDELYKLRHPNYEVKLVEDILNEYAEKEEKEISEEERFDKIWEDFHLRKQIL